MTQIADGGEILTNSKPVSLSKPAIILLILGCVLVLAVGIGISFAIFYPRKNTTVVINSNNPSNILDTKPKETSKFASDSAFLQLKSDIAGFASEIDRIDLIEPQLAPPNIDLNISVQIK